MKKSEKIRKDIEGVNKNVEDLQATCLKHVIETKMSGRSFFYKTGVHASTFYDWKNGKKTNLGTMMILKIADGLGF